MFSAESHHDIFPPSIGCMAIVAASFLTGIGFCTTAFYYAYKDHISESQHTESNLHNTMFSVNSAAVNYSEGRCPPTCISD